MPSLTLIILQRRKAVARPKWHIPPTMVLIAISIVCYTPLALVNENALVLFSVLVFGVIMDYIDHLSIRRLKKLYKVLVLKQKEAKGPVEGWVNWMHTSWALAGVIVFSIYIWNTLPLISYIVHILIDGGNQDNVLYPNSPLPAWLHKFYPHRWTYSAGLII